MTTNKPGTVTQRPLFGCASCYEDFSYPADHLHVYNDECWCEICWEEATHEIADGRDWSKLEPFKPALQAECALLRAALRRLCNIYVVDDYYDGYLRDERLEDAVNRAINAVMETTK